MFCKKIFYSKIENIHHKTLKVFYGIGDSYSSLLLRSKYVSIHQKLLRFLVAEISKSISQIDPEFMWLFFKQKTLSYNLRKGPILTYQELSPPTKAFHFRGYLVLDNLPT